LRELIELREFGRAGILKCLNLKNPLNPLNKERYGYHWVKLKEFT